MRLQFNNWIINVGEIVKIPFAPFDKFGEEVLPKWVETWFQNNQPSTYIEKNYSIPSIIIRVDGILIDNEILLPFEIEERPAGIGVSLILHKLMGPSYSEIDRILDELKEKFNFIGVESPNRKETHDDNYWLEISSPEEWETKGRPLVWPRTEPHESSFYYLEEYSLSSISREGDKRYGEYLGWWQRVSDPDELPWERSFVLKPNQGSRCKDVVIWDKQKRKGSDTKSKIERTLAKYPYMYLQEFIEPMEPPYSMVRVFYTITSEGKYQLGWGLFFTRLNLRIHGASDSLISLVSFV